MVSLFPQLFDYGFLATGMFRIALGFILVYLAYQSFFTKRNAHLLVLEKDGTKSTFFFLSIVNGGKAVLGLLLIIGVFTQVATLIISAITFIAFFVKIKRPSFFVLPNTNEFYILFFIVSLVLAFLGPGAFAIDLPL